MGRATVSDLDDLEWKPWPKTPHYFFVDLHEEVRLQWDTQCEVPTKYTIRTVSPEFPFSHDIIRHLTKRQVMFHLEEINRYIAVLPLTRETIYEPIEL